jgi:hypothetical protein
MRKRLGQILIEVGVIDDLQLRSALAEAARWGKRVGEVLVARGHCTDAQILEALATQLRVGIAPLAEISAIPPRILRLLPPAFARDKQVLPLDLDGRSGTLKVAVADPAAYELLDELRFRTGHDVQALAATPGDLADAIEHFYFGAPRRARVVSTVGPSITVPPASSPLPEDVFVHGVASNDFAESADARGRAPSPMDSVVPVPPAARRTGPVVQIRRGQPDTADASVSRSSVGSLERSSDYPSVEPGSGAPSLATGAHKPFSFADDGRASRSSTGGTRTEAETPPVGAAAQDELARLRHQVVELQDKVDRAYKILREAALAHRTLLQELAERGVIDRNAHARKVQERIGRGDGPAG